MKHLVDTNVLLEAALQRQHWQEAADFLRRTPPTEMAVSEFTLHALGIYLVKRTPDLLLVTDLISRQVPVLRLEPRELGSVTQTAKLHRLDFDDAFLYTLAERHGLNIISFAADFDRTPRGRKMPSAA